MIFTMVKWLVYVPEYDYGLYLRTFVLLWVCASTECVCLWCGTSRALSRGHWVIWQGRGPQDVTSVRSGCPSAHARRLIFPIWLIRAGDGQNEWQHSLTRWLELIITSWSVCCFTTHTHTYRLMHIHAYWAIIS